MSNMQSICQISIFIDLRLTHTHTNQREKYSAMRSEPDIEICAINKLTLLD